MTTLKVYGRRDDTRVAAGAGTGRFLEASVSDGLTVDAVRSADARPIALDLADDDIVQIILEDGLSQWVSFAQLRADLGDQLERGGAPGELTLPARLQIGGPTRGTGDWAIQGLRILKVDLPGRTAAAIAKHIESKLDRPGLCRWLPGDGPPAELGDTPVPTDRPVLLFLHGTASRTAASFGGLAAPGQETVRRRLRALYGDHIYAFEHPTLTESPIGNAIDLLNALPKGVRLHIVSHSRGGLVGELLCRGENLPPTPIFDDLDRRVFEGHPDAAGLNELARLLADRNPRVERFVRVACPASGTTLASRRLDRYLSILVNLAGLIPALKSNPIFEFMTSLLLAVVKQRTDPSELPGLEAQMPDSPLIRVLNRPGVRLDSELYVVSGDIEGGGIFQRLGVLATDAFYCEDHDLVVNTRAMYGGAARSKSARYFFDRGPRVNHFSYFENRSTANAIVAGLEGAAADGFRELRDDAGELPLDRFRRRSAVPLPTVFVLPGIMGTHLAAKGNRIWLDLFDIAIGRMERLEMDAKKVEPVRLVGSAYDALCEFLAESHEVIPFPYDWRRSLVDEAARLGDAVAERLEATDRPVRIMAHSMGGLLARTMISLRPEVWKRLRERQGSRLIMLGTPNDGSYVIPRVLLGREKVVRQLILLDLMHGRKELLGIIARFRGMLELLPAGEAHDFFDADIWTAFREASDDDWVPPTAADLESARHFRQVLDNGPIDPEHMLYVAGLAPATPVGHEIVETRPGRKEVRFIATPKGDGRVPWSTGILPGLTKVFYIDAEHGGMAAHKPSFAGLLDLLESGTTSRLTTLPFATRGIEDRFPMPEPDPQMFPDRLELEAAAVGLEPTLDDRPQVERVRVSVSHGNLAFAHHPVAVGHYEGDTIVSAEGVLDRHLDGRLSERHRIGLYPGPVRTAEVLLNHDGRKPGGAIVMGLGRVGQLTAGLLTATFTQACLRYATVMRDRDDGAVDPAPTEMKLTSLLIGTGESGLSVEDSIRGILGGVEKANEKLGDRSGGTPIRIGEIELLELYRDRAVQAARALRLLSRENAFEAFDVDPEVHALEGGRERVFYVEDPQWWRPIQIEGETQDLDELHQELAELRRDVASILKDDSGDSSTGGPRVTDPGRTGLRFLAVADRARAPVSNLPSQRKLVDGMIASAIATTSRDAALAQTMYELLIPNELKRRAPEQRNVLLVVDEQAAAYPWELLEDPMLAEPVAVGSGMVRQLITERYRETVLSPTEDRALVVGDPLSNFDALPSAKDEAELVARLLDTRGRFDVTPSINEGASEIMKKLFSRSTDGAFGYKVLHLAAHGVFEEGRDRVTGVVIGPNTFLTPGDIEQIRQVPELVFLNCCYLGRIKGREHRPADRHMLAANVGTQLIRMGVRAVVAAGWAVNDIAAATFARRFYEEMLEGREFGHAVHLARRATFERHGSLNTWGAYQCYGDPGYTLRRMDRSPSDGTHPFSDPAEAIVELRNLASDASTTSSYGLDRLRRKLTRIVESIPGAWLGRGDVRAALGEAYGQLDMFGPAIEHFEAAATVEKASQPLRSLERHVNFEARHAADLWVASRKTKADRKRNREIIQRALDRIDRLIQIGRTAERLSIKGSAFKRLARVSAHGDRNEAIARAEAAYREAHELILERTQKIHTYPHLNWLALMAIRRWRQRWSSTDGRTFRAEVEAARLRAADLDREYPSFFHAAAVGESVLVRHLGEGDLEAHADEVTDGYLKAWRRGGSLRQLSSVTEHLSTLADLLKDDTKGSDGSVASSADKTATRQALGEALNRILESLARATETGATPADTAPADAESEPTDGSGPTAPERPLDEMRNPDLDGRA